MLVYGKKALAIVGIIIGGLTAMAVVVCSVWTGYVLAIWFITGGILDVFRTIVGVAQWFFQHDWKLSEVVLVLLLLFLVVRKRR